MANIQMKAEELGQNLDGDLKFRAWVEGSDGRLFNSLRMGGGQERKGLASYKIPATEPGTSVCSGVGYKVRQKWKTENVEALQ